MIQLVVWKVLDPKPIQKGTFRGMGDYTRVIFKDEKGKSVYGNFPEPRLWAGMTNLSPKLKPGNVFKFELQNNGRNGRNVNYFQPWNLIDEKEVNRTGELYQCPDCDTMCVDLNAHTLRNHKKPSFLQTGLFDESQEAN